MRDAFDRRVVSEQALAFVRACQRRVACHLAGGAALSGAHLAHRLSADLDLFLHAAGEVRVLARQLPDVGAESGTRVEVVRDQGSIVRALVRDPSGAPLFEADLVHESVPDLEPPAPPLEGVVLESFADLRASKLTCILERSEPRDLVDLLFLERAGFPPERDLAAAARKDAGLDPAVLAWLLSQFPVEPMPIMLEPLSVEELHRYRNALAERFRALALP